MKLQNIRATLAGLAPIDGKLSAQRGAILVYNAILLHADDSGRSRPSIEAIASLAHMSAREAKRVVKKLVAAGALRVFLRSGPRGSHTYLLTGFQPEETQADASTTGGDKSGCFSPDSHGDKSGRFCPDDDESTGTNLDARGDKSECSRGQIFEGTGTNLDARGDTILSPEGEGFKKGRGRGRVARATPAQPAQPAHPPARPALSADAGSSTDKNAPNESQSESPNGRAPRRSARREGAKDGPQAGKAGAERPGKGQGSAASSKAALRARIAKLDWHGATREIHREAEATRQAEALGKHLPHAGVGIEKAVVEVVATWIESHPKARQPRSVERRQGIARRVEAEGLDWVVETVAWVFTSDSEDARRIWEGIAKYPDGVVPGEDGADRLEEASWRLDLELDGETEGEGQDRSENGLDDDSDDDADADDDADQPVAAEPKAPSLPDVPLRTSVSQSGTSRRARSTEKGAGREADVAGRKRIVAPVVSSPHHADFCAAPARAAWEAANPENAFVPIPDAWKNTIRTVACDSVVTHKALMELANNPTHRKLVQEFAQTPESFTRARLFEFVNTFVCPPPPGELARCQQS